MSDSIILDVPGPARHSSAASSAGGRVECAQNGHVASGTPTGPLSPYRINMCLIVLGWSVHEFSRRTGEHRMTIRRWLDGVAIMPGDLACWLEALVAAHLAHPCPRRRRTGLPS